MRSRQKGPNILLNTIETALGVKMKVDNFIFVFILPLMFVASFMYLSVKDLLPQPIVVVIVI